MLKIYGSGSKPIKNAQMIITLSSMNANARASSPRTKRQLCRLESASKRLKRSQLASENDLVANALLLLKTSQAPPVQRIALCRDEATLIPVPLTSHTSKENLTSDVSPKKLSFIEPSTFQKPNNPDEFLSVLLAMKGRSLEYTPAENLMASGYFTPITEDYLQGYTKEMVQAVRSDDVATLRRIYKRSCKSLLCGSKFGDSILHLACRRGSANVVEYLIVELGVSPKVVCDLGRTLFHDALWTTQPNTRILSILLKTCPELLFVTDHRGATALSYAPKQHWSSLCRFLAQHIKQYGTFLNPAPMPSSHVVPLDPVAQ
jgi:Ankyrin repeats (3 copies)